MVNEVRGRRSVELQIRGSYNLDAFRFDSTSQRNGKQAVDGCTFSPGRDAHLCEADFPADPSDSEFFHLNFSFV
jgi:hypothetical protein